MRRGRLPLLAAAVGLLCACGRSQPQQTAPTVDNRIQQAAPAASAPTQPAARPVPPAPPPAQTPVVDPKSSEAAEMIVRSFIDLLNHRRFDEAYMLLGPGAPPRSDFDRRFAAFSDLSVTMGAPGDQEGAAGSIYLSIPVHVSGRLNGDKADRSITVILRRVNDVPGSTDAQRHWHIERIDAQSA